MKPRATLRNARRFVSITELGLRLFVALVTAVTSLPALAQNGPDNSGMLARRLTGGRGPNPVVLFMLPRSSAEAGGLEWGDAIVAVDGASVTSTELRQTYRLLRGAPGSKVSLTVRL